MADIPLTDSAIRAWRANEQAKALYEEIGTFMRAQPYTTLYELQSKEGENFEYLARLKFRPLNPMWNVRIGEILHNVRASLDNAIWELVRRNHHVPSRFIH